MNFQHTLATLAVVTGTLHGAGFQLQERSAVGLGRAYSGEAAIGDDASVLSSNPAAMLLIPGETAISVGITAVMPDIDVRGNAGVGFGTVPTAANDIADSAYIPFLYLTHDLSEDLTVGFGSFTAFGLSTNYPESFAGRGLADKSKLTTVNLNPSLAWRFAPKWSLGLGFNAVRAEATLTSSLPNSATLLDVSGDAWGYGYNVGFLYEWSERTRFGLHYRSEVDMTLKGQVFSAVVPFFNGPGTADVTLPDSLEFSAYHELNDQWAIHGDVVWTGWNDFQTLAPKVSGNPAIAQPPATMENWEDVWRVSLGTTWRACEALTLRAGVAYDESPVEPRYRTLRIPDADRIWLSVGASYHLNPCWSVDFGYTHLFADSATIQETGAGGTFTGTISGSTEILSLGVSGFF